MCHVFFYAEMIDNKILFVMRFVIFLFCLTSFVLTAQSPWEVTAKNIDPAHYYGVTVANGMVGIVSSPEPLKVKDVVLNGVYDNYQRGRVSNILKGFNHVNMQMDIDGQRLSRNNISDYAQTLDMREAKLVTTFRTDLVQVRHEVMALRHLPYTALVNVTITNGAKAVEITPMAVIEAPDHLRVGFRFHENVAVGQNERRFADELLCGFGGLARAVLHRLPAKRDPRAPLRAVGKMALDHVGAKAGDDENLAHAGAHNAGDDVFEHGLALHLEHGLGQLVGEFPHPRAFAGGQNDCFHARGSEHGLRELKKKNPPARWRRDGSR